MATKEQVTEFINAQWEQEIGTPTSNYWDENIPGWGGNRIGLVQRWMSPEVAGILEKLVGPAIMIERIAKNRSNTK